MREWPDCPLGQQLRDLGQQLSGKVRPTNWQLIDVNREIRDILAQRSQVDAAVEVKIALAEFEEAAKRPQNLQAPLHRLAAQRVEDDVDALPGGYLPHGIGEGQVARVEHVVGTGQTQKRSL